MSNAEQATEAEHQLAKEIELIYSVYPETHVLPDLGTRLEHAKTLRSIGYQVISAYAAYDTTAPRHTVERGGRATASTSDPMTELLPFVFIPPSLNGQKSILKMHQTELTRWLKTERPAGGILGPYVMWTNDGETITPNQGLAFWKQIKKSEPLV